MTDFLGDIMAIFKFFWKILTKYKKTMYLILSLLVLNSFLGIINPYISGIIVDDVIVGGKVNRLALLLAFLAGCVVAKSFTRYFSLMLIEKTSQKFLFDMRNQMYTKMQMMDFNYFDRTKTGNIMTRITGDLEVVRNFVAGSATVVFESFFSFIFVMIVMTGINFPFTMLLLAVTPFIGILTFLMTRKAKPLNSRWHDQVTRLNSVVQESISGNKIVKAFTNEEFEIKKFTTENEGYKKEYGEWVKIWKAYLPPINFLGGLITVILILVGGILVINGKLSYGQLVIFTGLVGTLSVPINMANWLSDQVQKFFASGEKIIEIMKLEPKIADIEGSEPVPEIKGNIDIKNMSFKYEDALVLRNINLSVKQGQTIGIIGPTGSGKSTLVSLLCRFYDCSSGEILIDGVNIKHINKKTLRDNIVIAMQDTFLFSDTIEGNISYGMPDAPVSNIENAARIAEAHDFILKLSEVYDTIVGERGVGLSGGQKQRVSLARSLLKEASVLILDDITSSVDVETEQKIQSSLRYLFSDNTTFIISHRISSVKDCDFIIVIDKGTIIEQGNHKELIALKGYYYNIFAIQSGLFSGEAGRIAANKTENIPQQATEFRNQEVGLL